MSTYIHLQCLDHDPPLWSDDEVGQHLYDLPDIRKAIADRDLLITNAEWIIDHADYFTGHAVRFLRQHPKCHIGIIDEYGIEHEP